MCETGGCLLPMVRPGGLDNECLPAPSWMESSELDAVGKAFSNVTRCDQTRIVTSASPHFLNAIQRRLQGSIDGGSHPLRRCWIEPPAADTVVNELLDSLTVEATEYRYGREHRLIHDQSPGIGKGRQNEDICSRVLLYQSRMALGWAYFEDQISGPMR